MRTGAVILICLLLLGGLVYFITNKEPPRPVRARPSEETQAYKELSAKLRSSNAYEATHAIEAIVKLNKPEGFALLENVASRKDRILRLSLLSVCNRIPKKNAGKIIAQILDDPNIAIQNEALKHLEAISDKTYNLSPATPATERQKILLQARSDALSQ